MERRGGNWLSRGAGHSKAALECPCCTIQVKTKEDKRFRILSDRKTPRLSQLCWSTAGHLCIENTQRRTRRSFPIAYTAPPTCGHSGQYREVWPSLLPSVRSHMTSSHLSWCVDGDEHHVRSLDLIVDVGGKEQVAPTTLLDNVQQPGLVDGKVVGVPRIDLENDPNVMRHTKRCILR